MSKHAGRLVAALVVALTAVFVSPVAALASPVDPARVGSLTIHKYLVPEGSSIDAGRPAKGVTFTVARVLDVDLTTNAGWQTANELASGSRDVGTLGPSASVVTDASGRAVFADLALGLYRVTETTSPVGVDPIDPFYVTVPLTDPEDGDAWLYDVHVYPKNLMPTVDPSPGPSPSVTPPLSSGAGGDAAGDRVPLHRLGVTGAETAMLTAFAVGLFAVGAWLVVIVGRLRRRHEEASDG